MDTIKRMEHEYSFREELHSDWAVRPLALSQYQGRNVLLLEDPGGDTVDQLLPGPIIPRKRREGLINGMIWLDSATTVVVRESGYLAENPSIFVKRINVKRENELRGGSIATRITHILAETRLVGEAQFVIVERPASDESVARRTAGGVQ